MTNRELAENFLVRFGELVFDGDIVALEALFEMVGERAEMRLEWMQEEPTVPGRVLQERA